MTIARLLQKRLPARFLRKSDGNLDVYALAEHLSYRPQTIYEWFRKGRLSLPTVEVLMNIEGATFQTAEFEPFCADLVIARDLLDRQAGGVTSEN